MRFNSVLIPSFLLLAAGLADCRHMDRRVRRKQNPDWAGAVWEMRNLFSVTETFKVPEIFGPNGYGASAWVGIDGDTCTDGFLHTGVAFTVTPSGPLYRAWYEWSPTIPSFESYSTPVNISAGDVVRLVVTAPKPTFAWVMIENISNNQSAIQQLKSTHALCGQDAGWVVEDFTENGAYVPLVNFGAVAFTDAQAGTNTGGTYGPQGATILDIAQYGQIMDAVWVTEDSVTIKYSVSPEW